MIPAHQYLCTQYPAVANGEHRLQVEFELAFTQADAQFVFKSQSRCCRLVHFALEHARSVPAGAFGVIHRGIGMPQQRLDGIAIASAKNGISMNLTPDIVYRAIAANPYGKKQTAEKWSDLDPSLPDLPILVYGPPSTSGTRDALKELILEAACKENAEMKALKESDEDAYDRTCTEVRMDGKYVDQGEQDNLIVQKIQGNPNAVGVFGYSYLEENTDKVKGLPMNGVEPTYENIASFNYPGARPLFVYVKKAHVDAIPGLAAYLQQWTSMWNKDGPLAKIGLVASPDAERAANVQKATALTPVLAKADLEKK